MAYRKSIDLNGNWTFSGQINFGKENVNFENNSSFFAYANEYITSEYDQKLSSLKIKIFLNQINQPSIVIPCFDSKKILLRNHIDVSSNIKNAKYKLSMQEVNHIKEVLNLIIDQNIASQNNK